MSAPHRAFHPSIGMRRVDWVGVRVEGGTVRCEAHGVGHRLPTQRQISLDAAAALGRSGVPVVLPAAASTGSSGE